LKSDPFAWGRERELAVFFLSIREFSAIAEKSLPYDTVFILNHFFDRVASEIEDAGGYVSKFDGDGVMAIFGLQTSIDEASRAALNAAVKCHSVAQREDDVLAQHLDKPLNISVGIHSGKLIIGRIGKTADQTSLSRITAIGTAVNVAETFEKITGKLDAGIVYSSQVHEHSGLGRAELVGQVRRIKVNDVAEPVGAVVVQNSGALKKALERLAATAPAATGRPKVAQDAAS